MLDDLLVCWLTSQAIEDRDARLVDGGADVNTRIELAQLFIDLPAFPHLVEREGPGQRKAGARRRQLRAFLADSVPVMPLLLHGPPIAGESCAQPGRWLLIGGPGSGKSTLTRMLAQQLRVAWIDRQPTALPPKLDEQWHAMRPSLVELAAKQGWRVPTEVLALRIDLPSLARWMADRAPNQLSVWDYLAHRVEQDLAGWELSVELSGPTLRGLVEAVPITWVLDGLDEVPATAGRADMIKLVRASVCDDERASDRIVVSTRPQGYGGEFNELDELELCSLPPELASEYAERLLRTWHQSSPGALAGLIEHLRKEIATAEVAELLHTPLHTTMAAVLIANRGSLPVARNRLFDLYFQMIWRRELHKPFECSVEDQDEEVVRALHQRAGLILHVRSQVRRGARASLRRHELRQLLATLFAELGYDEDGARAHVDRLMRFAAERLVLLLHASQGEYEFGVRSLQEFFAAGALLHPDPAVVRGRLEAVVLNSHWSNVLAFLVSEAALRTDESGREAALAATVGLCRGLNDGVIGGQGALRCSMGSRLAMHMLAETERYGHPWLHDPLWEVALEAASVPVQHLIALRERHGRGSRSGWTDATEVHTRLGVLAGSWSKVQAAKLRQRVLALAQEALSTEDHGEVARGWRLLHGLLLAEMPEAVELADRCAPRTRNRAHELAALLLEDHVTPAPGWLSEYVDRHPELFLLYAPDDRRVPDALVFRLAERLAISDRIHLQFETGRYDLVPLLEPSHANLGSEIPEGPGWTRWRQVAAFLSAPSHLALADLLDSVEDEDSFDDFRRASGHLSWPLTGCLWAARTLDDLRSFGAMLRDGELGTLDDWTAAQTRWRAEPNLSMDDLLAWLDSSGPWNRDIAERGAPVFPWWISPTELDTLLDRLALAGEISAKAQNFVSVVVGRSGQAVPLRAEQLVDSFGHEHRWLPGIRSMHAGLVSDEREEWLELLDQRGRKGCSRARDHWHHPDVPYERVWLSLCEHLRSRPERWGLIEILSHLLIGRYVSGGELSIPELPPLPDDAPAHALAARALLRLAAEHVPTADVPALLDEIGDRVEDLAQLCDFHVGDEQVKTIIIAALDRFPNHRERLLAVLYGHLRRAPAPAFSDPDAWKRNALPAPYLGLAPQPPAPPRLRRITELSNIRLFKTTPTVDTPFPTPSADRGQWIVLVGENGVGKTTLLRALALALASAPVASKLLDERLPMLRNGAEARITIELDSGPLAVAVSRQGRTEQVESRSPAAHRPWVVGYGVRRGNARGESDRDAEVGALGELHTLFDRPASLHNATQWIAELDADVLREQRNRRQGGKELGKLGPREQVWRSTLRALEGLLGITKVEVAEGGLVFVEHPDFGRVRLDALSDGYLTTAGWIIDMLARWVERQYELDEPIGPQLLQQMCGFVLIDEIDLHLHPTWQLRILENIRRQFPRLSFVVTTHNPLTLQGARRGEVYVMRRHADGIELVQRDIRPGHDVDRVLLEQFGLEHTFDQDTRKLLHRHRQLVEDGVALDDPDRARLEAQLRERFGDVGDTLGNERELDHGAGGPLTPEERERFLADLDESEA